jgi:hypothetical protein
MGCNCKNKRQPPVIMTPEPIPVPEPTPDCMFSGGSATYISTETKTEGE